MSAADLLFVLVLICFVPPLVEKNLSRFGFARELRLVIVLGGISWIFATYFMKEMQLAIGLEYGSDSVQHVKAANLFVREVLEKRQYDTLLGMLMKPGRVFYEAYQGIIYYYTGATDVTIRAINGFMAFWGGLTLVRLLYAFNPLRPSRTTIIPVLLIFMPSVFFWGSDNLKEAFMYWSVCQIFAFMEPAKSRRRFLKNLALLVMGSILGSLQRPHIIAPWVIGVGLVKMLRPRYLIFGGLLLIPAAVFMVEANKKLNIDITSFEEMIEKAEYHRQVIVNRAKRSTFTYRTGRAIPVFHGMINTMFRPFLWHATNLRSMVSAMEIWTISLTIILLWSRMKPFEWQCILRNPSVQAAILVCIPFFFFFTYTPNEGLIARQRIQMYPALLVLAVSPFLQQRLLRLCRRYKDNDGFKRYVNAIYEFLPVPIKSRFFSDKRGEGALGVKAQKPRLYFRNGKLFVRRSY